VLLHVQYRHLSLAHNIGSSAHLSHWTLSQLSALSHEDRPSHTHTVFVTTARWITKHHMSHLWDKGDKGGNERHNAPPLVETSWSWFTSAQRKTHSKSQQISGLEWRRTARSHNHNVMGVVEHLPVISTWGGDGWFWLHALLFSPAVSVISVVAILPTASLRFGAPPP